MWTAFLRTDLVTDCILETDLVQINSICLEFHKTVVINSFEQGQSCSYMRKFIIMSKYIKSYFTNSRTKFSTLNDLSTKSFCRVSSLCRSEKTIFRIVRLYRWFSSFFDTWSKTYCSTLLNNFSCRGKMFLDVPEAKSDSRKNWIDFSRFRWVSWS